MAAAESLVFKHLFRTNLYCVAFSVCKKDLRQHLTLINKYNPSNPNECTITHNLYRNIPPGVVAYKNPCQYPSKFQRTSNGCKLNSDSDVIAYNFFKYASTYRSRYSSWNKNSLQNDRTNAAHKNPFSVFVEILRIVAKISLIEIP